MKMTQNVPGGRVEVRAGRVTDVITEAAGEIVDALKAAKVSVHGINVLAMAQVVASMVANRTPGDGMPSLRLVQLMLESTAGGRQWTPEESEEAAAAIRQVVREMGGQVAESTEELPDPVKIFQDAVDEARVLHPVMPKIVAE